jgi:mRNA-degrading endonuclease RelE of RelBE toxin-antitoxin system
VPERRLRVPGDVASLIQGLHPDLKRKLRAALHAIIADPSVGKTLRDELAGLRSYRIGRFRLVCRVAGSIIEIVAVGPRASIHEETWRRVRRDLSSR